MNEIDPQEEIRYRRAMMNYMRLQSTRLRIYYFNIYFRIFSILFVIRAGTFAYFHQELVMEWWNYCVDYLERWVESNL